MSSHNPLMMLAEAAEVAEGEHLTPRQQRARRRCFKAADRALGAVEAQLYTHHHHSARGVEWDRVVEIPS